MKKPAVDANSNVRQFPPILSKFHEQSCANLHINAPDWCNKYVQRNKKDNKTTSVNCGAEQIN